MTEQLNQNNTFDISDEKLEETVKELLNNYPVVLFMKGEKEMPACGFSAGVVQALNNLGVDFEAVNILSNEKLRAFMKEFSNWPTYPQLYYKGNLVGGYDIIAEMYQSGELKELFSK